MRKTGLCLTLIFSAFFLYAQQPVVDEVYVKRHSNWQKSMSRWKLRNFVPLIGLDLLKEGDNTFGGDPGNDIVVQSPDAPLLMGIIKKEGKTISYFNTGEIDARLEGQPITAFQYTFDEDRNSERIRNGFISWYVQYVEQDYFLRLIDDTSPLVSSYEPYEYYEPSQEFIFTGKYKTYKKKKIIPLDNVISLTQRYEHTGKVSFRYKGKKYELEVVMGSMVMFSDKTNGTSTFPFGRYVRVSPEEDGTMILDFNYSFSPPRSVSLYTTCDLPPPANHLPFPITAGEKYGGEMEGIIRTVKEQ